MPDNMLAPWGYRETGDPKGMGYLGMLLEPGGKTMSEYSINVDGQEMPSLVPTLTDKEVQQIINGKTIPDSAMPKIIEHARVRRAAGLDPFATPNDVPQWRRW